MKISELIKILEEKKKQNGDLEVQTSDSTLDDGEFGFIGDICVVTLQDDDRSAEDVLLIVDKEIALAISDN